MQNPTTDPSDVTPTTNGTHGTLFWIVAISARLLWKMRQPASLFVLMVGLLAGLSPDLHEAILTYLKPRPGLSILAGGVGLIGILNLVFGNDDFLYGIDKPKETEHPTDPKTGVDGFHPAPAEIEATHLNAIFWVAGLLALLVTWGLIEVFPLF